MKVFTALFCACMLSLTSEWCRAGETQAQPVIIDTDIGSFYDDGAAIAFALQSPNLDVKLVVTCSDNTTARAQAAAKFLTLYGRDDIPIGIGVKNGNKTEHSLFGWAGDVDLSKYKGGVFQDGVGMMGELILNSTAIVDIMAIGPATNFPELLSRFPDVPKKARIRAMGGSIKDPAPEYNVRLCPLCWAEMLHAGWNVSTAPLDTTVQTTLTLSLLQTLLTSSNGISLGLASSLVYFCSANPYMNCDLKNTSDATPKLFDSVATLLTLPVANDYLVIKELNITVSEDGSMKVDNKTGVPMEAALYWKEKQGLSRYKEFLVSVLVGGQQLFGIKDAHKQCWS